MTTKTMKEKATELLQRCEVVTLASVSYALFRYLCGSI